MPDEMMDSLRKAFMKDKKNAIDECPMADKATDYAFGELGPDETETVKKHIHTCRHCLDLVMDIKMAEEEAESMKDQNVEVLPGLQKAIDSVKSTTSPIFHKIGDAISGYISKGLDLFSIDIVLYGKLQMGFRGGQPEYNETHIEPDGSMNSGDYFRFETKIDNDAFVYVVFQDSLGNIESMEKGYIAGNKAFFLPDGNKWYHLDQNAGTEKLYLLASKKEIKDFNNKIEDLKNSGIEKIGEIFRKATIRLFSFEHR